MRWENNNRIFFRILRYFENYNIESILDEKTKRIGLKNILKGLNIENADDDETIGQVINEISYVKNELMDKYNALFESLTCNNFEITRLQSEQLLPYVKEIILRQQRRQIPTILEGTGIIPNIYFPNNRPLPWLTKHVVFINLYLSDEKEHISRRKSRSEERGYHESASKTQAIISQCRAEKNQLLHMQAIELQKMYKNIFSIDISDCTPTQAATRIMERVFDYFKKYV